MSNEQKREAFENHPSFKGMDFTRSATHPEYYESPYANGAWDGYRAAQPVAVDGMPEAAETLRLLGYTYSGGQLWKPPLGKKPDFDQIDALRAEVERLKEVVLLKDRDHLEASRVVTHVTGQRNELRTTNDKLVGLLQKVEGRQLNWGGDPLIENIRAALASAGGGEPPALPKPAGWIQGWPCTPGYTAEQMEAYRNA